IPSKTSGWFQRMARPGSCLSTPRHFNKTSRLVPDELAVIRVRVLAGNPDAAAVVDGDPLGRPVARAAAEQLPVAVEGHDPGPVMRWQVESGIEVLSDLG